jgi:archaellum component FlaC
MERDDLILKKLTEMESSIATGNVEMIGMKASIHRIESRMDDLESTVDVIASSVINLEVDIRETMATKDDLKVLEERMVDKIATHVDGFIKLHTTLEHEHVALRSHVERIDERLTTVESK